MEHDEAFLVPRGGGASSPRRRRSETDLPSETPRGFAWRAASSRTSSSTVNVVLTTCRRRFKTGFIAGTKPDRRSEGDMAEDRGPNVLWWEFEDPETEAGMVHEGDGLAESGG